MRQRHKIRQPRREAIPTKHVAAGRPAAKAKKKPPLSVEGEQTKQRLDKFRRGGRSKKYDAGGSAPDPTGGMPSTQDFISTPKVNPVTRFVQGNIPPTARYLKLSVPQAPSLPTKPGVPTSVLLNNKPPLLNSKRGGRIARRKKS